MAGEKVIKNVLDNFGIDDKPKIGTCDLCGKKGVRVWAVFGGTEYRCDECEDKYG